jgi:fatty-acyl-CoA synthase
VNPLSTILWPPYRHPSDIAAIEQVPLSERGLPDSTYHLASRAAELWPARPAMSVLPDASRWTEPTVITFASLMAQIHAFANALSRCGIGRGDAVAIIAPNCAELTVTLLAAEIAGIAAPINPGLSTEQMAELISASNAGVIVAAGPGLNRDVWAKARAVATRTAATALLALHPTATDDPTAVDPLEGMHVAYLADLAAVERDDQLVATAPVATDLASYFHTGGTTGVPKLAAHTHANEVADAWMIAAGDIPTESATLFGALPLFHVNALVVTTLAPLFKGQHVVWGGPLGYRDPELFGIFWKLVERYGIAAMSAVPTVYGVLAQVPLDADISSLELAIVGAAPLPLAVRRGFEAHTGVALCEGYGLTEATCVSARSFPSFRRPDAVGQRMPYQQVKAVRIDTITGKRADLGDNETGILMISGPTVFPGYVVRGPHGPTLDPVDRVVDGWLDTGDLGSVDAEGFIRLSGRAKDLIIRGGHNIDPVVIEDALLAHPDVVAASAVGSPDPYAGEVPVAYVALVGGSTVDPEDLVAWASERVPERAAAPRRVFVLAALPLTDIGKPFKPELRRDATQRTLVDAVSIYDTAADGLIRARLVDGSVVVEVADGIGEDVHRLLDTYPITWTRAMGAFGTTANGS